MRCWQRADCLAEPVFQKLNVAEAFPPLDFAGSFVEQEACMKLPPVLSRNRMIGSQTEEAVGNSKQ